MPRRPEPIVRRAEAAPAAKRRLWREAPRLEVTFAKLEGASGATAYSAQPQGGDGR